MQKNQLVAGLGAFLFASSIASGALAGSYPSKPITMIIPWKPGGTTETMGQVLSKAMAKELIPQAMI